MSTAIVYVILFSLLTIMVIGSSNARFLALFTGIVLFPLGISFLKSPTLRPQDLFLYGFLVVAFMKGEEEKTESKTSAILLRSISMKVSRSSSSMPAPENSSNFTGTCLPRSSPRNG